MTVQIFHLMPALTVIEGGACRFSACYARDHEYLGFSAGLDFETKIMVKENAPELLRRELSSPKWKPQTLAMSGVVDCYQPIERRLQLTRRCLAVRREFRNPVTIITKNHLVASGILTRELAVHHAVAVHLSINSLDSEPAPQTGTTGSFLVMRLAAIEAGQKQASRLCVLVAPVIPALNDHEMPSSSWLRANLAGRVGLAPKSCDCP